MYLFIFLFFSLLAMTGEATTLIITGSNRGLGLEFNR